MERRRPPPGAADEHNVFGEAMAILAGDAMVTMAFEVIAADAERGRFQHWYANSQVPAAWRHDRRAGARHRRLENVSLSLRAAPIATR